MTASRRLFLAAAVVAIWACITIFGSLIQSGKGSLAEMVTTHIALAIPAAALFLLVCAWAFGWRDLGLNGPRPRSSVKLLWPYAVYIGGLALIAIMTREIPVHLLLIVAVNTALVGFSEELAFRGVLWGAVRKAMSFWPGVFLVSAAFGAVHVMNALITGELAAAGIQALNAFLSGLAFLALRIRTRSLWPVIAAHGLWDMVLFLTVAGAAPSEQAGPSLAGVLFVTPIALYGLWLLRKPEYRLVADGNPDRPPLA